MSIDLINNGEQANSIRTKLNDLITKVNQLEADQVILDTAMSNTSTNGVQNKVIKEYVDNGLDNKEDKRNKVIEFSATPNNTRYPSEKLVYDKLQEAYWETYAISSKIPGEATDLNKLTDRNYVDTELAKKVDKVEGKGLSKNDYTDAEKAKVAEIDDKENVSNKVTALSSKSTDTQYPSAKVVYDGFKMTQTELQEVGAIAKGAQQAVAFDTYQKLCEKLEEIDVFPKFIYATFNDFPSTGEIETTYVAADTDKEYRWSQGQYKEILYNYYGQAEGNIYDAQEEDFPTGVTIYNDVNIGYNLSFEDAVHKVKILHGKFKPATQYVLHCQVTINYNESASVLKYNSIADFPETGEKRKMYVAIDTNKAYRWSNSNAQYLEISRNQPVVWIRMVDAAGNTLQSDIVRAHGDSYTESITITNPFGTSIQYINFSYGNDAEINGHVEISAVYVKRNFPAGYRIGQNFYVAKLDVPDVWVSAVNTGKAAPFDWTVSGAEADFISALTGADGIDIGYYTLRPLETQKVALENYVEKEAGKSLSTNDYTDAEKVKVSEIDDKYEKPQTGIPKTDLSEAVQESLEKADSAVQDISGKVDKYNYELIEKRIIGYAITAQKPADWDTNYTDYYTNEGTLKEPNYIKVPESETPPEWRIGTYYSYNDAVMSAEFNTDSSGNPYNFKELFIRVTSSATTTGMYVYPYINNSQWQGNAQGLSAGKQFIFRVYREGAFWMYEMSSPISTISGTYAAYNLNGTYKCNPYTVYDENDIITSVKLSRSNQYYLSGVTVEILGGK